MSENIRRVLDRRWIDEHETIHVMVLEIRSDHKVHVLLQCTNEHVPEWGMLAVNHTYNPATCLWCIAEEQQGDTRK